MNKGELHLSEDRNEFESHSNNDAQKMRQKQVTNSRFMGSRSIVNPIICAVFSNQNTSFSTENFF